MKDYRCSITTSTVVEHGQGDATASQAADGRDRVEWGCDIDGRGVSVIIKPLSAGTQFALHSVRVYVVPYLAGPDEQ